MGLTDVIVTRGLRAVFPGNSTSSPGLSSREVRSPKAATSLAGLYSNNSYMIPAFDPLTALQQGYYGDIYTFRAIQIIAQSVSSCHFRTGTEPSDPENYDDTTTLAKLLGSGAGGPNVRMSSRAMWRWIVVQWLTTGRFCLEIERDPATDKIVALWPLSSNLIKAVPSEGGDTYFAKFTYGHGSAQRDLRPDQVIYCWRPSADDFRQPETAMQAAHLPLSVKLMLDRYEYGFLRNNATPTTIVTTEAFADPKDRRAFRDQFRAEFTGYQNTGKTLFAEAGVAVDDDGMPIGNVKDSINITRVGSNAREMQLADVIDAKIRDICVTWGVPLSLMGDASGQTYANADQENRNFWLITMYPLLRELEDAVNLALAPLLDLRVVGWFDTSHVPVLQAQPTFKQGDPLSLIEAGIIDPDEFRADLGLPPLPAAMKANVHTPTVVATASGIKDNPNVTVEAPKVPVLDTDTGNDDAGASTVPGGRSVVTNLDERRKARRDAVDHINSLLSEMRHGGKDGHHPVVTGHKKEKPEPEAETPAYQVIEKMLTEALRTLLAEQAKAVAARLGGRRGRQMFARTDEVTGVGPDAGRIYDPQHWTERGIAAFNPAFTALANPHALAGSRSLAEQLTAEIQDGVQTALMDGFINGDEMHGYLNRVEAVFVTYTHRAADLAHAAMEPFADAA